MKTNIERLLEAAGDEVTSQDLDLISIEDLVENFLVGTERRKKIETEDLHAAEAIGIMPNISNEILFSWETTGGNNRAAR